MIPAQSQTWWDLVKVRSTADEPAVITASATWSGRELFARARGGADFLDAHGAPAAAPVVALLASTPSAFALTIAAAGTGRPLAPLGPRLTLSELVPCAAGLPGELIVCDEQFLATGEALAVATGRRLAVLSELEPSDRPLPDSVPPDGPAVILHTSGTTGLPKAVPYRQDRLVARVRAHVKLAELGPGAVYCSASPLHHIAGLGMLLVVLGSGAALMPMPSFGVGPWRDLSAHGATHVLIVPTMIEMLLSAGELALPGLRVLQYGASPIRPETLAQAMEALPGVRFVNLFGQTEGSPIAALTMEDHERAARDRPDLLDSVGRPAPGVELYIDTPDEHGVGEVVARAPHFFRVDDQGWLRTGDLGRLDGEGYLFLSGRKGDKIIRGGENVYPVEVENVLAAHPAIAEACVFGLRDGRYGEIVAAAVVRDPGSALPSWDDLRAYARQRLAGFKVPTQWEEIGALPRNASGKVLRRALAARHQQQGLSEG